MTDTVSVLGNEATGRPLWRMLAGPSVTNVATAAVTLAHAAVLASVLGPEHFGLVAVALGVMRGAGALGSFESWQLLTREAAHAPLSDAGPAIERARALDLLGALSAAGAASMLWLLVVAAGVLPFASAPSPAFAAAGAAALATSAPAGILRLAGRYVVVPLVRLAAAVALLSAFAALAVGGRLDVANVVATYAVAEVCTLLATWAIARRIGPAVGPVGSATHLWRTLRSNDWRFVRYAYLHSTLKLGIREFDVLLAGFLLDARGVGHLKLVKQLAGGIGAISLPLFQLLLPELARANGLRDRRRFLDLLRTSALVGGGLGAVMLAVAAAAGRPALEIAFGPAFAPAHATLLVWLLGTAISLATIALHPAQLALGRADASFRSLAFATALYYAVIFAIAPSIGPMGFAIAFVTFYLAWTSLQVRSLIRDLGPR